MKLLSVMLVAALAAGSVGAAEPARRVGVSPATASKMAERRYTVKVKCRDTVKLGFPTTGKLAKRQVDKDHIVQKGQVLAQLDDTEQQWKLEKARSAAARTAATYARMKNVQKGVSAESLSQAESDMKVAAAELKIAEKELADLSIVAPFDGIVVKTSGDIGAVIPAGSEVTRLHSLKVKIELNVPEGLISSADWEEHLRKAENFVTFASHPGLRIPARFAAIDLVAEESARTFVAEYLFDTPPNCAFFEGMTATLFIRPEGAAGLKDLTNIPADALCAAADGKHFVWMAVPQHGGGYKAERRAVEVYDRIGETVSVTGAIKPGDLVVTLGAPYMVEGLPVTPLAEEAK